MKCRRRLCVVALALVCGSSLNRTLRAQENDGLVAKWSFEDEPGKLARDSVSGIDDRLEGYAKYPPGVSGKALLFDSSTTAVVREGKKAPRLKNAFTLEAWLALNTYPWGPVPVVDHQADQQVGYAFSIDPLGHVALGVSVDRVWRSVTTTAQLPLKKWVHVAGVFDSTSGLSVYIDGTQAAHLDSAGEMSPLEDAWYGQDDLVIGRVRQPTLPVPSERDNPKYAVIYSLDGLLDEVKIFNRPLHADELQKEFASAHPPAGEVLPWPALPAGPPGPGPFGAYYTTLHYEDTWDAHRRIGPDSDVVVRFDQAPIRLVFWQGTNYIPAWATENNRWYTDEFVETWGPGCPDGGDCEPMSDKQSRYSHVRILESNDARAVVHWRYALSEVENYKGAHPDELGWFDWADEYWTVYPDGVAIRKQVLRTTDVSKPHEWQESIVINGAGQRPEDNINLDAVTLANMKGETATYTWPLKTNREFTFPPGPQKFDKPQNPNIQVVNLKSEWKPFQVVAPGHSRIEVYNQEKTFYTFECWNHWPISQLVSSGRPCLAPDRASHSSLSHIYWDIYESNPHMQSKLLMSGLTAKPIADLAALARAWLSPAKVVVNGPGFRSEGYDPAQRAFVLARDPASAAAALDLTLDANSESPVVNPAIVVKAWGDAAPTLKIDAKPVPWGKDFRYGLVHKLEGTDLILWIRKEAAQPLRLSLAPRT
jgi:hypothetical protein